MQNSAKSKGGFEFDLVHVANTAAMLPRQIMSALWDLQKNKKIFFKTDGKIMQAQIGRSQPLDDSILQEICDELFRKLNQMEMIRVLKLDEVTGDLVTSRPMKCFTRMLSVQRHS